MPRGPPTLSRSARDTPRPNAMTVATDGERVVVVVSDAIRVALPWTRTPVYLPRISSFAEGAVSSGSVTLRRATLSCRPRPPRRSAATTSPTSLGLFSRVEPFFYPFATSSFVSQAGYNVNSSFERDSEPGMRELLMNRDRRIERITRVRILRVQVLRAGSDHGAAR
ncbi:hypothetical protein EXIGLDRAFT_77466 [Exidia glandulosa HHB12029]|uniref:Uncharacterized protein n=1 Tax=Exidia glandulosa HHB12029 TaxID=1314781 RepID=A0A165NXQ1_EXIGL|nr:hypothetical protein EXIGLDRAFT_77466 [Exidia glandulosa HHB12029]